MFTLSEKKKKHKVPHAHNLFCVVVLIVYILDFLGTVSLIVTS